MIWLYEIPFYYYILAGFIIGTYTHSRHVHHWIHWTAIKVLSGIIWFLVFTDPLYKKPKHVKTTESKVSPAKPAKGIEVEDKELARLLKNIENNPDVSIRNT